MVVRVKSPQEGYLALHCTAGDEWVPVTGEPVESAAEAEQECLVDLKAQIDQLEAEFTNRLETVSEIVGRLRDRPKDEAVYIDGVACAVDADGAIELPQPPPAEDDDRPIDVGPEIVATIERVLAGQQATQLLTDLVLDEPLRVLAAVAEGQPELLARAAAFMVAVYRKY
ncbi:MAG: hypothetical protein MJE77_12275 [Proteobacteria bacterium]|nr:hypothetical protein [Pseudomonadota bacterium]